MNRGKRGRVLRIVINSPDSKSTFDINEGIAEMYGVFLVKWVIVWSTKYVLAIIFI